MLRPSTPDLSVYINHYFHQVDFCRICHCEADSDLGRLIAPCKCRGTLRNVHQACLQQWIKSSGKIKLNIKDN